MGSHAPNQAQKVYVPALNLIRFAGLLPLFAAKLEAQIPVNSPTPQTSAPQVFRVTTRLVEVNVVVTDKNGRPAKGLKKENFTLLDQGQLQDIAIFYGEPDKTAAAVTRTPPNVFTNRLADRNRAT